MFRPLLMGLVYALTVLSWLVAVTCMVPILVAGGLRRHFTKTPEIGRLGVDTPVRAHSETKRLPSSNSAFRGVLALPQATTTANKARWGNRIILPPLSVREFDA